MAAITSQQVTCRAPAQPPAPARSSDFGKALPDEVQKFIQQQITSIGSASRAGVSITLVIAVAIALWSASGGVAALVTGVNVARDQTEPKSFAKKRGKALALTFGAVVLLVVMMFLIAAVPSILTHAGLGTAGRVVFDILRWPLLALVIVVGLGVLYHVAVGQPKHGRFGVTPGALAATLLWLIASGLFAVYTANFASYSKTYARRLNSAITAVVTQAGAPAAAHRRDDHEGARFRRVPPRVARRAWR
jgi:membrane protein